MLIRVGTKNDPRGNPRRGWVQVDNRGALVGWIEEGYEGRGAIAGIDEGETLKFNVPFSEYRRIKLLATAAGQSQEASK